MPSRHQTTRTVSEYLPVIDISKGTRRAALEMLASGKLFQYLRQVLSEIGLRGEEEVGVALFFVFLSRFRRHPLRLAVEEAAGGGRRYAVEAISELLEPGALCLVYRETDWKRFSQEPDHKVILLSEWSKDRMSAHCNADVFTRSMECEQGGRVVVDKKLSVHGHFVCVSSAAYHKDDARGRWLRLKLPEPSMQAAGSSTLTDDRRAMWVEVQKQMQRRSSMQVLLPDWADLLFAYAARNDLALWHMPAYLEVWKTMALLRSFQFSERWQQAEKTGFYVADFSDLAHARAVIRAFRESTWFPSLQPIFEAVCSYTQEVFVKNPFKDGGKWFRHPSPQTGRALRPFWEDLKAAGHI
jgi:hypothetical protein